MGNESKVIRIGIFHGTEIKGGDHFSDYLIEEMISPQ